MNNNTLFISGVLLLCLSGIIFAIERLTANIHWFILFRLGEFPTTPEMPTLYSNFFVILYLVIGIALIIFASMKHYQKRFSKY